MEQEKEIFNFLFEKFKQNENNKKTVTNLVLELVTTKEKISEILKPLLIDREGAKRLQKLNENEKKFLEFTYFLFMSWNSYTELKDDDREIIIEFLNN